MAHTEIIGHGSCPLHKAKTEIRRTEWFLFSDEQQITTEEVCLDCGFHQEKGFFSTNATTAFEHSIFEHSISKQRLSKEEAASTVIATNTLISPREFQALREALGQEVEIQFHCHKTYSNKKPGTDEEITERFVLKDVNFVRAPLTTHTYLAFLKTTEGNTNFPYWVSKNVFGDYTEGRINSLKLHSGEKLWCFDCPKERVGSNRWGSGNITGNIIQAIKDHSESMLALVINQTIYTNRI